MHRRWNGVAAVMAAAGMASGGGAAAASGLGPLPVAVWNHAYQENYERDTFDAILAGARNAYVLLDPFLSEVDGRVPETVAALHDAGNEVSAYISIGTGEDWRDDFEALKPYLTTTQWDEWGGEYFISTPNDAVLSIMKARIDRIADWGFDWVEFDNMDWVYNDDTRSVYGAKASIADGVAYYQDLCAHVHAKGMKCMAKSTVENAGMFDGATYESYEDNRNWWDQAGAEQFLADDKLVIVVHYDDTDSAATYTGYQAIYGPKLSFICEERALKGYKHFNTK